MRTMHVISSAWWLLALAVGLSRSIVVAQGAHDQSPVSLFTRLKLNPIDLRGCFLADTLVTMSDYARKPIGSIQPGDMVLSWNESHYGGQAGYAQVLRTIRVRREALVDIDLGGAGLIHATADHPFWSFSRKSLMSADPQGTHLLYGLNASPVAFNDTEIFQNEEGLPLEGRFTGVSMSGAGYEVVTLELDRLHWFFVGGVRVHNKGGSSRRRGGFSHRRSFGSYDRRRRSSSPSPSPVCNPSSYQYDSVECRKEESNGNGRNGAIFFSAILVSIGAGFVAFLYNKSAEGSFAKAAQECKRQGHDKMETNCLERRAYDQAYWEGWICDNCEKHFPGENEKKSFYRCYICELDFCETCYGAAPARGGLVRQASNLYRSYSKKGLPNQAQDVPNHWLRAPNQAMNDGYNAYQTLPSAPRQEPPAQALPNQWLLKT